MGSPSDFVLALGAAALLAACDLYKPDEHIDQYVVEAFMIAAEPLPQVRVSTSTEFGERFSFESLGVRGADVTIVLLDADDQAEVVYKYQETSAGLYEPEKFDEMVRPRRSYALSIDLPDSEERIKARTTVPDTFSIIGTAADSVVYQASKRFAAYVTPSHYPGRQSFYIATLSALNPDEDTMTPFFRDLHPEPHHWIVTESEIFNESSLPVVSEGLLSVPMPWALVAYFGPNRFSLYTIDDNIYDYWRSAAVQRLGSTLSPGEIPNVVDHVDGGIGLFGGMAQASVNVYVRAE